LENLCHILALLLYEHYAYIFCSSSQMITSFAFTLIPYIYVTDNDPIPLFSCIYSADNITEVAGLKQISAEF